MEMYHNNLDQHLSTSESEKRFTSSLSETGNQLRGMETAPALKSEETVTNPQCIAFAAVRTNDQNDSNDTFTEAEIISPLSYKKQGRKKLRFTQTDS